MEESNTAVTLAQVQRDHFRAYVSSRRGLTPWWFWPTVGGAIGTMLGTSYVADGRVAPARASLRGRH
jgi:hypothetical protein